MVRVPSRPGRRRLRERARRWPCTPRAIHPRHFFFCLASRHLRAGRATHTTAPKQLPQSQRHPGPRPAAAPNQEESHNCTSISHLSFATVYTPYVLAPYSKKNSFRQWSPKFNINFLYFYKNIYHKVIYLYFNENIFKTSIFIWFLYFETQQLKSYSWFMFPIFDPNLVQNDILFEYGGSIG